MNTSATSPSSVNSNFSLSDFVSDTVALDMNIGQGDTDTLNQRFPDKDDQEREVRAKALDEVFEKEGSLNSLMITVIVSLQHMLAVHYFNRHFLLQVDDIHFRLDSHFLQRESETLKAIIAESEVDSIRLQNVTAAEFRALCRFFYEG